MNPNWLAGYQVPRVLRYRTTSKWRAVNVGDSEDRTSCCSEINTLTHLAEFIPKIAQLVALKSPLEHI
jgi:hypothetical protein